MHILLLGGGGREHALAWKLAQSPLCERLTVAPGNGGIAAIADCVACDIEDPAAVVRLIRERGADFVVIGPEAPLAAGVADALDAAGIACFGPSAAAARLESSKRFTKEVCDACGAPTAAWASFEDPERAIAYIREQGAPIVVKEDGLAAGKGVTVAETVEQAISAVEAIAQSGGGPLVIEECMRGEEVSLFALCDGERALPLPSAQDHKRAFDGDKGPNTGGMGAYSPAPVMTAAVERRAMTRIVLPVLAEMARRGTPYRGVLYAGLMVADEEPRLIEFNVRFGDPEAQALMMRLRSDLVPALRGTASGDLFDAPIEWSGEAAITVVLAAKGYPGAYRKGEEIRGLDAATAVEGVEIFHAGTRRDGDALLSNGGRVLNVCAVGADLAEARRRAYAAIAAIDWPGGFHRRDIGWRAL